MNLRAFKKAGFKKSAIAQHLNSNSRTTFHDDDLDYGNNYHDWAAGDVWYGAVNTLLRADPTARVYGIELELPCEGSLRMKDIEALDKTCAIRKSDGSLRGSDIEFNFPPLTAKYLKRAKLVDHIGSIMSKYAYDEDYYDDDDDVEYGVHIHSNRGWMDPNAALFIVNFIRTSPLLCKWISGRDGYSSYGYGLDPYHRYAACFTHKNTIEYRIFRSTTDQREVNVWLDFIMAVEDWAHTLPNLPGATESAWGYLTMENTSGIAGEQEFIAYVMSNKRKYSVLARALAVYLKHKASTSSYSAIYNVWSDYDVTSLYAVLWSILPKKRERKVKSDAQLHLPLPVAA